jgi:hypothetical protein
MLSSWPGGCVVNVDVGFSWRSSQPAPANMLGPWPFTVSASDVPRRLYGPLQQLLIQFSWTLLIRAKIGKYNGALTLTYFWKVVVALCQNLRCIGQMSAKATTASILTMMQSCAIIWEVR